MKHEYIVKVYHQDTDCYGVVWHGTYIRWFEIGRVELSHLADIDFKELQEMGTLMPVVELNCRYKSPGRLMDELLVTTEIKELKSTSITFLQTVKNIKTDNILIQADCTAVTTDVNGKLNRKMPDYLYKKYEQILNKQEMATSNN